MYSVLIYTYSKYTMYTSAHVQTPLTTNLYKGRQWSRNGGHALRVNISSSTKDSMNHNIHAKYREKVQICTF